MNFVSLLLSVSGRRWASLFEYQELGLFVTASLKCDGCDGSSSLGTVYSVRSHI
jgi:hypothetical protein